MPALITMISSRPNRSMACAMASRIPAASALSACMARAFRPAASTASFDGLCRLVRGGYVGQGDIRAILRQASDDRGADAPGAAENHCDLTQQFAIFTHDYLHY